MINIGWPRWRRSPTARWASALLPVALVVCDSFAPGSLGTRPPERRGNEVVNAREVSGKSNRSNATVDVLPAPADGGFHVTIQQVPASVLARSTWHAGCPVASTDLRYVTVGFIGFDGRAHTGELLVHASAAHGMAIVFKRLFKARFPIERMYITSVAELNGPPTGDGNTVSAFVCRAVRGASVWSQHAYGLAVDINPFQNPYHRGDVVIPELASSYLDRTKARPGMVFANGPVVTAFTSVGWKWGGNYRSLKDYMHFSANGK